MENQRNHKTPEELEEYKKQLIEKANKKYSEFLSQKEQASDEKVDVKSSSIFEKAKSYADAVMSRGLSNKECSKETKVLRLLSCHGEDSEILPPCSERRASKKYEGSFYCGACGCGDKKGTQLVNITIQGADHYSKLDYPRVSCPLKMPGFTDYVSSKDGVSENNRKKEIENRYGVEYITEHSNK